LQYHNSNNTHPCGQQCQDEQLDNIVSLSLIGSPIIDPGIISTRASREVETLTRKIVRELVEGGQWIAKLDTSTYKNAI